MKLDAESDCRMGLSGAKEAEAHQHHRRITRRSGRRRSPKMTAPSGKDGESGEGAVRPNEVSSAKHPHPTVNTHVLWAMWW